MTTIFTFVLVLVLFLYLKWIMIVLVLPFQSIYGQVRRMYKKNMPFACKIIGVPYYLWEKFFRGGWERYMIYHVGLIPSFHLRRYIYKLVGVSMRGRLSENSDEMIQV